MRWIKYFESSSFYTKLSVDEYNEFTNEYGPEKFTRYEKSRLKEEFDRWTNMEISYIFGDSRHGDPKNLKEYMDNLSEDKVRLMYGGRIFGKEINIGKRVDGWYVIDIIPRDAQTFASRNSRLYESYRKYYKCDQFEGVLSFIDNNLEKVSKLL